jgi:hypothetical protein
MREDSVSASLNSGKVVSSPRSIEWPVASLIASCYDLLCYSLCYMCCIVLRCVASEAPILMGYLEAVWRLASG